MEKVNETGLAVARRVRVLNSISINDVSSIQGNTTGSGVNSAFDVVDSKSNSEKSTRISTKQLKHKLTELQVYEAFNVILAAVAIAIVIFMFAGCKSKDTKTASDLVNYTSDLDSCREVGKDAGSYKVYEDCAKAADVKYGRKAQ
jgi:hypothetical protein